MDAVKIRTMAERKYEKIPINRIKVLNSRNRDNIQREGIIRSINAVGLLFPIVVNERNFKKTRYYELVCGEGRYLAYKKLGYSHIPAEVINCSRKQAFLYSLGGSIPRVRIGRMWFAHEVKRMYDAGWTYAQIGGIIGKCKSFIRHYIHLVEQEEKKVHYQENTMKNLKVLKTTNYDMFKVSFGNRPPEKRILKKLKEVIKKQNLLKINPILIDEKNEVIDGKYRLAAAKELGLPIFYIKSKGIPRAKAVAYYRHSAQDRQENSIPVQRKQVRKFAEKNGIEIIREFC